MRFVLTVAMDTDPTSLLHKTLLDSEAGLRDVTATMLSEALMDASDVVVWSAIRPGVDGSDSDEEG
jgi:hypothetical protein